MLRFSGVSTVLFEVALESFIDMNHELVILANQIDWEPVEPEFAEYQCTDNCRPSVLIRKMVGMMLLKNIYNLGDEGALAHWLENPYMLYFTGEKVLKKRSPMKPIGRAEFCKRAGIEPVIGHLKSDPSDDAELSERCPGGFH